MSEEWQATVPRWRGERGWKRNKKTMREKPKADETNNYAYNKWLQPFANNLRNKMTKAEACLWKYVLKNINGVIQRIEKVVDAIGLFSPPPVPMPAGDMTDSTQIRDRLLFLNLTRMGSAPLNNFTTNISLISTDISVKY